MKANVSSLVLALAALGALVYLYGPDAPWTAMRALGAVLTIISGILLVVARLQLGSSFSVQPTARSLVTSGIYSRIRNPIYLFSSVLLAGVTLYFDQPRLLLVILLVFVPIQIYRARREEKVLTEAFGEEYVQYKAGTWF
jgi:protein-S-isoprenylcysteine O-methyltransferase Ste14